MRQKFYEALTQLGVAAGTAADAALDFQRMADNHCGPADYWECSQTGAYKECYYIDSAIVKFAVEGNHTMGRERPVYRAAIAAGLSEVFAHTIFLPLKKPLLPYYVGENNEKFDCVIIQEKVAAILGDREVIRFIDLWAPYSEMPLLLNEAAIPYDIAKPLIKFNYQDWIQAGLDFYGLDYMLKLADFCEEMQIDDLHAFNLGFRGNGSPVIFDFTT